MATNHTYTTGTYGGVPLHIITTAGSNIKLLNQRSGGGSMKALKDTTYFGVNAAWFNMPTDNAILNIAMNNGSAVGPGANEGKKNSVGTGAICWNGSQLSSYASVTDASSISFSGNANTWVQGGIHLWLGYGLWQTQVQNQSGAAEFLTGAAARTAMIAHMANNKVYLIVTTSEVTFASFRSAIQTFLGIVDGAQANNSIQGIMLDGGKSSQLRAKNSSNTIININTPEPNGYVRVVPQIVVLKNDT